MPGITPMPLGWLRLDYIPLFNKKQAPKFVFQHTKFVVLNHTKYGGFSHYEQTKNVRTLENCPQ
jgi:hypothetical protein